MLQTQSIVCVPDATSKLVYTKSLKLIINLFGKSLLHIPTHVAQVYTSVQVTVWKVPVFAVSDNMAIWQTNWTYNTILIKLEKYFFNEKENKQIDN